MSKAKTSAVLSALFMGAGQLYNQQIVKGLSFLLLELFVLIFCRVPFQYAMWGLTTLGEEKQVRQRGRVVYEGDHSIFLMIEGIIALISFLLFVWVYYLNIRDAYKVGTQRDAGIKSNNTKQMIKNMYEGGFPYMLLIPSIVFTAFLTILPLLFGILIAFTNYSGPNHLPPKNLVDWVGFQSFIDLFQMETWSNTFFGVFGWTVVWAIGATVSTFFVGLFFAIVINHPKIKMKRVWRSIFILPWAIPGFVSILIMKNLFNGQFGPINKYLREFGEWLSNTNIAFLEKIASSPYLMEGIPWLSDPIWAKTTLLLANVWFGFPFWMILMSGVMTGIDKEMYEAADVDGATGWSKFRKITLPIVMFSTAPLLIMSFAGNFNNFNMIYLLTQGGPVNTEYSYAGSTDILISWIYKLTLDQSQFAMASVVSILIFFVIAAISIWNFRRTKAFKEEDMMS